MWKCLEPPDFEDDRHWRFGMFYNNPGDPRLIVRRRHGWPGVTVNWAQIHWLWDRRAGR